MILRRLVICLIVGLSLPAAAQERVLVVTQRQAANGALFLAAVRGYFKAEGLDLQVGVYRTPQEVVEAVASGRGEFGLTALTPAAFNLAGRGAIKAIAVQVREQCDYESDELVAANAAYDKGLRKFADLAGKLVALQSLGSAPHYQLGQIARVKGFDLAAGAICVRPAHRGSGQADRLDIGDRPAADRRAVCRAQDDRGPARTVEKFVRAYRRDVADYTQALLRRDRYCKRVSDSASQEAAGIIARTVFPGRSSAMAIVEANAPYMDPKARIDVADIARQIDWYKAQGFVEKNVDARDVVDLTFTAGRQ
jgi:NitT/TauT family transport system substrate-binding protein